MTDRYGNVSWFQNGTLTNTQDANGNIIYFNKNSSGQYISITKKNASCGTETVATFTYNSSGYLTSIVTSAGTTTYSYGSNNVLSTVTHPDGTTVSYTYNGAGKLLSAKDNESAYSVFYDYYGATGKVSKFYEKVGGTVGGSVLASGQFKGVQTYRYNGRDRILSNSDDLCSGRVFDYYGRTISSYTTSADSGILYGASASTYSANSGTSGTNNRTLASSSVGVQAENYITEGGVEGLSGVSSPWSFSGGGSGSIATNVKRTGYKSLAVTRSAANADSVVSQTVTGLTANGWYVLSAYVNTSAVTSIGGGVFIRSGSAQGAAVTWNTGGTGDGWERVYVAAQANASGSITLQAVASGISGSVYFDDFQVEPSISGSSGAPSSVNLVYNGNMVRSNGWSFFDSSRMSLCSESTFGRAMRMYGTSYNVSYARQTIKLNQPGTQTYLYSGWAKAASVPLSGRNFHLRVIIYYAGETSGEVHAVPYSSNSAEWQYNVLPIVPKCPTKTVDYIIIEFSYNYNVNTAYFTNACLTREDAQSYKYNSSGDLISVSTPNNTQQTYSYSGADLIREVTKGSGTYSYGYDSKHNVTSAANDGVTMAITRNSSGSATATTLSATGTSLTIGSSAVYDANGNRVTSQTDARGSTTTYLYETEMSRALCQPSAATDSTGVVRRAFYLSSGRVQDVYIPNVVSLWNTYSSGRLVSVGRSGFLPGSSSSTGQTYYMTYNSFGSLTGVSVGSRSLATYAYAANNGNLTAMTYANGASVSYGYDVLERQTEVYYNGSSTPAVKYSYNGEGELSGVTDVAANRAYAFNYDALGRLVSMTERSGANGVQILRAGYDTANRATSLQYQLSPAWDGAFGSARTYGYAYDNSDGSLASMTAPSASFAFGYDALKRLTTRTTSVGGSTFMTRQYGYLAGSGTNRTTTLVSSLTNKDASGGTITSYNYTYDSLGNITAISGSTSATYTYDAQSQLLTETSGGVTTTYTYDTVGNIRSRTDGTTADTYTYGDSSWLDLLTAYNGQSITYDAIGNPTVWYDGTTFTWSNGKRLTAAANETTGLNVAYNYDADGLRLTKTVGTTEHRYIWQGSRLVSEYYDGRTLEFFYDESGNPYALSYKASSDATPEIFYYVTNLQGDILQLRTASGSTAASYTYNAWGEVLTSSGDMADINPLRYRGYYYDAEIGFYYLQSRYYSPEICRFINADTYASTGQGFVGCNMFVYCNNNPINMYDSGGKIANFATMVADAGNRRIVIPTYISNKESSDEPCFDYFYGTYVRNSGTYGQGLYLGANGPNLENGFTLGEIDAGIAQIGGDYTQGRWSISTVSANARVGASLDYIGAEIGARLVSGEVGIKIPLIRKQLYIGVQGEFFGVGIRALFDRENSRVEVGASALLGVSIIIGITD